MLGCSLGVVGYIVVAAVVAAGVVAVMVVVIDVVSVVDAAVGSGLWSHY